MVRLLLSMARRASAGARGPALARRNGLGALFLFREGAGLRRVPIGRFDANLA